MYMQSHNGDENNCTIVSIANLTGKDYSEVREIASACEAYHPLNGTEITEVSGILSELGISSIIKKPRRGADKLTGLVHFFSSAEKGHTAILIQGKVLDTDGSWQILGYYRKVHNYRIRCVNVINDWDVDWSIIPDSLKQHFNVPKVSTCSMCLSSDHLTKDCPLASIWTESVIKGGHRK